jgi:hypothetical protein
VLVGITSVCETKEGSMNEERSGYGRSWKKWLGIYLAVGAAVYLIVYLLFFHHGGSGGGGGFGY